MSDNHGSTPAAWTAVSLIIVGFVVGGIGLMAYSWVTFWIGVAFLPLGGLVGAVMARNGMGVTRH